MSVLFRLKNILFYGCTTFCLSIHLFMDICLISTLWVLCIMLQWTLLYRYLFKFLLSLLLCIYWEVKLLDHMVIIYLNFWSTVLLFSTVALSSYILTDDAQGSRFSTFLPTSYFVFFFFFNNIHPNEFVVVSFCGFDLQFSDN